MVWPSCSTWATFRPLHSPQLITSLAIAYREHDIDPLVRRFLDTTRAVVRGRDPVEPSPRIELDDDLPNIGI